MPLYTESLVESLILPRNPSIRSAFRWYDRLYDAESRLSARMSLGICMIWAISTSSLCPFGQLASSIIALSPN